MKSIFALIFLLFISLYVPAFAAEADCSEFGKSHFSYTNSELYESAKQGSAESQYELGLAYEYGRGIRQNDAAAICWYENAARQRYPDAQYRLAVLFDNGWGIGKDRVKAFTHYRLAAREGHVMAQHDLAMMYFYGVGTLRNLVQAYRWLTVANQSGNDLMLKHLKRVASEMTPLEIRMGKYLAAGANSELGI